MDVGGHMNKPKFSVRYTALVNRAAAVAKHEGDSLIERRHLLAALCAMSPKLLNRLLGRNQLYIFDMSSYTLNLY